MRGDFLVEQGRILKYKDLLIFILESYSRTSQYGSNKNLLIFQPKAISILYSKNLLAVQTIYRVRSNERRVSEILRPKLIIERARYTKYFHMYITCYEINITSSGPNFTKNMILNRIEIHRLDLYKQGTYYVCTLVRNRKSFLLITICRRTVPNIIFNF